MLSRWWCGKGKIGSLKQRIRDISPLINPSFLGSRRGFGPFSFGFNYEYGIIMKRGMCSSSSLSCGGDSNNNKKEEDNMSFNEAKKLMKLVNVESLKMKLDMEGKEVIPYSELLRVCESMGVARSPQEASSYARVLDEAGVILLFRDKVYLHPQKVANLVRRAVPLALLSEDDPTKEELKKLQEKKIEIDTLAHKQVRRILWSGLGASLLQVGLFFRLTFWEFSWDVMEPIAFFVTSSGLVIGYAYFLFTSRDPTYQDFMKRLFISRQKKLIKRYNFDVERFKELQKKSITSLDARTILNKHLGIELDLEDSLQK